MCERVAASIEATLVKCKYPQISCFCKKRGKNHELKPEKRGRIQQKQLQKRGNMMYDVSGGEAVSEGEGGVY